MPYLLSARWVLPIQPADTLIENGALVIDGDCIIAVGSRADLQAQYPTAERRHFDNGLLMPGLVNAHAHSGMSLMRGIADDVPLMQWLEQRAVTKSRAG